MQEPDGFVLGAGVAGLALLLQRIELRHVLFHGAAETRFVERNEDEVFGLLFPDLALRQALQDNLAVELYPYYPTAGANIEFLVGIAAKSKGNVKRSNMRQLVARYDSELVSRINVTPNIFTGGTN